MLVELQEAKIYVEWWKADYSADYSRIVFDFMPENRISGDTGYGLYGSHSHESFIRNMIKLSATLRVAM